MSSLLMPSEVSADQFDPVLDRLKKAAPYLDEGYRAGHRLDNTRLSPSQYLVLRYCIAASANPHRISEIQKMGREWLTEARRRYRAGFYACPLGEPVVRR